MSTYDDLVELMTHVRDKPPTFMTREDVERWMTAKPVREPRRGVTPGGIEWRSWA